MNSELPAIWEERWNGIPNQSQPHEVCGMLMVLKELPSSLRAAFIEVSMFTPWWDTLNPPSPSRPSTGLADRLGTLNPKKKKPKPLYLRQALDSAEPEVVGQTSPGRELSRTCLLKRLGFTRFWLRGLT